MSFHKLTVYVHVTLSFRLTRLSCAHRSLITELDTAEKNAACMRASHPTTDRLCFQIPLVLDLSRGAADNNNFLNCLFPTKQF